jgi:hypothetical protein
LNEDLMAAEGCQRPIVDRIEAHGVEVVLYEEAEHKPIREIRRQLKNDK